MNFSSVPGFRQFYIEPEQGKPVSFNNYLCPSWFKGVYIFKDKSKEWQVVLHISVSNKGEPKLTRVEIVGSQPVDNNKATPDNVTRSQLKVLEQYRFVMVELAILWAIVCYRKEPFNPKKPNLFQLKGGAEIKALMKEIDLSMRVRITPDFLKGVAKIYEQAVSNGDNPTQAVMTHYRKSHRTATDYATQARDLGYLPLTTPGKITVKKQPKQRKAK